MDHAAEFGCADDVAHADAGDFFRSCCEIRRQMITRAMRSFFVVLPTPDAADVIQVLFSHDHELVQAFELQCLDEPFDMCPQIR